MVSPPPPPRPPPPPEKHLRGGHLQGHRGGGSAVSVQGPYRLRLKKGEGVEGEGRGLGRAPPPIVRGGEVEDAQPPGAVRVGRGVWCGNDDGLHDAVPVHVEGDGARRRRPSPDDDAVVVVVVVGR